MAELGSWLILICGSALSMLFSACTYALRTFNHLRLDEELHKRDPDRPQPLVPRLGQLILASATMRILCNVLVILAVARLLESVARRQWALHLALTGLAAFSVMVIFSVAIPSAWAKYAGEALLARTLPLLHVVRWLLTPLTAVMHWIDEIVRRLVAAPRTSEDVEHIEREILSAVSEGEREGVVEPEEKAMIESVLEFPDTRADKIMTPRTDIIAIEVGGSLPDVLTTIYRAGHSRIPVYEGSLDNIIGFLYAKDMLWHLGRGLVPDVQRAGRGDTAPASPDRIDIRQVMRPPLFVPESRRLHDLLDDLRRSKVHIAVVLDEFGGTAGLVTIEDILEEIVGEIADEHEQPEPSLIRRIDDRTFEVDSRAHVDDLNEQLHLALPDEEDYDTIGGLVLSRLGRIPTPGEQVRQDGVTITVLAAEPRRIRRLKLELVGTTTGG